MRVITPDIMFLVETPSVASKQKWIGHADRTIAKHLTKRGIEFDGTYKRPSLSLSRCTYSTFRSASPGEQRRFGFTLANGDKYEGEWEYGQPNGTGTFSFANGNSYAGKLRDGKPHGQGKISYITGGYYEGMWVQGRPGTPHSLTLTLSLAHSHSLSGIRWSWHSREQRLHLHGQLARRSAIGSRQNRMAQRRCVRRPLEGRPHEWLRHALAPRWHALHWRLARRHVRRLGRVGVVGRQVRRRMEGRQSPRPRLPHARQRRLVHWQLEGRHGMVYMQYEARLFAASHEAHVISLHSTPLQFNPMCICIAAARRSRLIRVWRWNPSL